MSVARRQRRSELKRANHKKQNRPGISKKESSSMDLVKQKEHSHADDNRGTHQALDGAATAMASRL
jgi:hypothetical protein